MPPKRKATGEEEGRGGNTPKTQDDRSERARKRAERAVATSIVNNKPERKKTSTRKRKRQEEVDEDSTSGAHEGNNTKDGPIGTETQSFPLDTPANASSTTTGPASRASEAQPHEPALPASVHSNEGNGTHVDEHLNENTVSSPSATLNVSASRVNEHQASSSSHANNATGATRSEGNGSGEGVEGQPGVRLSTGKYCPWSIEWRNPDLMTYDEFEKAFEDFAYVIAECYDALVAACDVDKSVLKDRVQDFRMIMVMCDVINTYATRRNQEKIRFGTTAKECIRACESRCDEIEREENLVPARDYARLARFERQERRNRGEPATRGPPVGRLSGESGSSGDEFVEPLKQGGITSKKTTETKTGKKSNKKSSSIAKKPDAKGKRRKVGKGKAKAVIDVDEEDSDANADDEGQSIANGQSTLQERSRSGPISDEAQAKINATRGQFALQVKEIADETGRSQSWVEKELFGHCARQRSVNAWNAFLAREQFEENQKKIKKAGSNSETVDTLGSDVDQESLSGEDIVKRASVKYRKLCEGKTEEEKREALKDTVKWYADIMDLSHDKTMNVKSKLKKCVQENIERNSVWYSDYNVHVYGVAVHIDKDGKPQSMAFGGSPFFEKTKVLMGTAWPKFQRDIQATLRTAILRKEKEDPDALVQLEYDSAMMSSTNTRDNYQKFFSKFIVCGINQCVREGMVVNNVQWKSLGKQLKTLRVRLEGWSEWLTKKKYIPGRPSFNIHTRYKKGHYKRLLRGWELRNNRGDEPNEAEKEALENPQTISQLRVRPWTDEEKALADKGDSPSLDRIHLITSVNGTPLLTVGDLEKESEVGNEDDEEQSNDEEPEMFEPEVMVRPMADFSATTATHHKAINGHTSFNERQDKMSSNIPLVPPVPAPQEGQSHPAPPEGPTHPDPPEGPSHPANGSGSQPRGRDLTKSAVDTGHASIQPPAKKQKVNALAGPSNQKTNAGHPTTNVRKNKGKAKQSGDTVSPPLGSTNIAQPFPQYPFPFYNSMQMPPPFYPQMPFQFPGQQPSQQSHVPYQYQHPHQQQYYMPYAPPPPPPPGEGHHQLPLGLQTPHPTYPHPMYQNSTHPAPQQTETVEDSEYE